MSKYFNRRYNKALNMLNEDKFNSKEDIINYCRKQVEKNYNSLSDYEIIRDLLLEKYEEMYYLPF